MARSEIKDFTQGNITKQLVTFALPLFVSNLLQVVYNLVDMMVVGQVLGKVGISAVSVGGDVSHLLTFIAMGYASAGQVLIARYIGGGQREKIGRFVGTMSGLLLVFAVLISTGALLIQDHLLRWMNTPTAAYQGAVDYATVCMVGLVFIYGYNAVSAILRGMGDSKHPLLFIAVAAVLNLALDLLFVVVLDKGPGGAALATVISQGVSFLCCVVFLAKNKARFAMEICKKDFLHWDKEMLSALLKLGTPMAIKSASVQISKLFVNSWINSYGVEISAFAGIANKVSSTSNIISNAMNTAGSTIIGQNIAAGKFRRVNQTLVRLAAITLTVSAILTVIVCGFPQQFFGLFTTDPAVLAIADDFLPIAVLLFLASALRSVMNALINGSGNYSVNIATAILDGIVMRIGLAVLFGLVLDMRHLGFWLGDALAGFTPVVLGMIFYLSGGWKKGVIKETA